MHKHKSARDRARRAAAVTAAAALGALCWEQPVAAAEPSIRLASAADTDTLTVSRAEPVRIHLNLPGNPGWSQANIGRLVARSHGAQQRIDPTPAVGADYVEHIFDHAGPAMLVLAAGPPSERGKSDAWQRTTHCTRLHLRVTVPGQATDEDGAFRSDPGQTAKLGLKIEVLPLIVPTSLRIGDDFPVRAYFNGSAQRGAVVAAYRPDGAIVEETTDSVGSARFKIDQAGKWIVRFEHLHHGVTYAGDVVFDVPAGARPQGGGK